MARAVIFIGTVRLARLLQMKIANSYKRTCVPWRFFHIYSS